MTSRPPQSLNARTNVADRARAYLKTISKLPIGRGVVEYAPPLERSKVLEIAGDILQLSLNADQSGRYFLTCPGAANHSGGKNARRDCEFMPDGAPTLRCFHASCEGVRDELNRSIRSACGKAKVQRFTDSTARATKAAEALLIGFDMSDTDAVALLKEWAPTCDPVISKLDLTAAHKSAKRAYGRASSADIGCLLHGRSMPTSLNSPPPPPTESLSVASDTVAVSKPKPHAGVGVQEPIYIGARGSLAKEVRRLIEMYEDDRGIRPHTILVGTGYAGALPEQLFGLPVERWSHRENNVLGEV